MATDGGHLIKLIFLWFRINLSNAKFLNIFFSIHCHISVQQFSSLILSPPLPIRFWYVLCVVVGFCSVCWLDGGAVLKSEFYNAVFIYFHSLICRFYVLPFHPEYEATFCKTPLQREYNNYITAPTICLCSSSYQSLFHKWTFPKKLGFIYFSRENFLNVKIWFFFLFMKMASERWNSQLDVISPFLQLHNKRERARERWGCCKDCCASFSSSTIHKRVIVNHSSELMNRNNFFLIVCKLVVCMGKFTSNVTCCCFFNFPDTTKSEQLGNCRLRVEGEAS